MAQIDLAVEDNAFRLETEESEVAVLHGTED